jgi:Ca2+-binding EF-hand superfamily protein
MSSEEEEADGGDRFDMPAPAADAFDINIPLELPKFPRKASPAGRRGSVIVVGGRRMSMSVGAEVSATLARLRAASASKDVSEMQTALQAAGNVMMMADAACAREIQALSMKISAELSEGAAAKTAQLRRSRKVRSKIERLWELMVSTTSNMREAQEEEQEPSAGGSPPPDVSRDGYTQVHVRMSKVLAPEAAFDNASAFGIADKDWTEDIARFSGASHIAVWLSAIKIKFKEASTRAAAVHGLDALFQKYDADGSGELDLKEFELAVRTDLRVDSEALSDRDLKSLFRAVDADGSGEVNAHELGAWLFPAQAKGGDARMAQGSVAGSNKEGRKLKAVRKKFRAASGSMSQVLGWELIFSKYDDDGNGELDIQEFTNAVREECGLAETAMSDEEIGETQTLPWYCSMGRAGLASHRQG